VKPLKPLKHSRKHPLPPPSEKTRVILSTWQRMDDFRLPDSVIRSVVQSVRLTEDAVDTRPIWTRYTIATAQLIALGCLIPDTLSVSPSARKYRPAPNADHLLTMAIAAALSPLSPLPPREPGDHPGDYRGDHLGEITEIPSRYFEIQTGRPRPKGVEIGGQHGA
jgi:hypothetical protein